MTTHAVTKTIRLSPEEARALEQIGREEHLSETVLLKKLVSESLSRWIGRAQPMAAAKSTWGATPATPASASPRGGKN